MIGMTLDNFGRLDATHALGIYSATVLGFF
jgi:hypothetical protein